MLNAHGVAKGAINLIIGGTSHEAIGKLIAIATKVLVQNSQARD